MDELNYEIMQMINEHQVLRSKQAENAQKLGDKDKYGFPFEPDDAINTNKLGFLETAMRLQTEANETFRFLRNINRHSPLFYKMSSELEKLVGQLGSICITKAVIEQQEGQTFRFDPVSATPPLLTACFNCDTILLEYPSERRSTHDPGSYHAASTNCPSSGRPRGGRKNSENA